MANLVLVEEATQRSKYSASHIRYLIRNNLVEGKRVSVLWMVDLESLLDYEKRMDEIGTAKHRPKSLNKEDELS
jgi:hypothetical protein